MQPSAPFADIESMLTDTTMGMLANVVVTPSEGEPFAAMFDVDTTDFFDSARGVDYVLRYASSHSLERGENLTVSGSPLVAEGVTLTVSEKPRSTAAGHEYIAPLVRSL